MRGLCGLKIHQFNAAVLAFNRFGNIGAVAWTRPDARVVAARVGALLIDGAHARFAVQVQAVVVAHALQREDARLLVETFHNPFFLQTLGDVLRRVAHLELVNDADADQVFDFDLDRQGAASGNAICTPIAAGRPKPIVPRPPELIQRRGLSNK